MTASIGHWTVVREVISSTYTGAQVMGALPGLVRRLLDEDAWRDFVTPDGGPQHHDRFTDFIGAAPPRGLGGRVPQLIALCGTDEELAGRVRRLVRNDLPEANPHGGDRRSEEFQAGGSRLKPEHNTSEDFVARLKRDAPDDDRAAELLPQVLANKVSPNAAARAMGWRKPRAWLTTPESVAARIRENFTADEVDQLIKLLITEES